MSNGSHECNFPADEQVEPTEEEYRLSEKEFKEEVAMLNALVGNYPGDIYEEDDIVIDRLFSKIQPRLKRRE